MGFFGRFRALTSAVAEKSDVQKPYAQKLDAEKPNVQKGRIRRRGY
jgi:hypothetical protein